MKGTNSGFGAFPYSEAQTIGLTKREYFAALALSGILSDPTWEVSDCKIQAKTAVEAADALIEALNEKSV